MIAADWREELEESHRRAVASVDFAIETASRKSAVDLAEGLKQTVRRLRQTSDESAALALVVSSSGAFCKKSAAFIFEHERARLLSVRGLDEMALAIDLKQAAAFFSAVETKDPVVAAATESELSKEFFPPAIAGFATGERAYLFPLVVKGSVTAVLFAMGDVQAPAVELLAEITAAHLESLRHVSLIPAAQAAAEKQRWEDLEPEQRAVHLRAQRFARLKVSEMRLYHAEAVRRGMKRADLYGVLKPEIDAARTAYRKEFPGVSDYLYLELVGNLANNDDRLLGQTFPGPII